MDQEICPIQKGSVCVTGGGAYIGSTLVKMLLAKGYTVHVTVRDPGNTGKTSCLRALPGANMRLKIFKADLCEEGSFDAAVDGCQGVFHVATPTNLSSHDPENEIIDGAIRGALNVLKACVKAKSVRRVVYTSSLSAADVQSTRVINKSVDESCWTSVDFLRKNKPPLWMYDISKTLAEQESIRFAKENGIDLVSILPVIVGGPSINNTIPSSIQFIMSLVTGDELCYGLLKWAEQKSGSVSLVHIEDICRAHIFLMEEPAAQGRYMCSARSSSISELVDLLSKRYPRFNIPTKITDQVPCSKGVVFPVSSKKLVDLGFEYKYDLDDILDHTIQYFEKMGVLNRMREIALSASVE